jgi:hypothetical protein
MCDLNTDAHFSCARRAPLFKLSKVSVPSMDPAAIILHASVEGALHLSLLLAPLLLPSPSTSCPSSAWPALLELQGHTARGIQACSEHCGYDAHTVWVVTADCVCSSQASGYIILTVCAAKAR